MKDILIHIVIVVVSSNAIFAFIQFLINRKDNKEKEIRAMELRFDRIDKTMLRMQQGNIRLQLIVLILLCPDKKEEIMEVAHKYFVDLKGNWYVDEMFHKWLDEHNIPHPSWLIKEE